MSAQQEAIEVLVYLMGLGFSLPPLEYLSSRTDEFDAVTLRHLVTCLFASVAGPFSHTFADECVALLMKPRYVDFLSPARLI